jgi:hypothetical protein
MITERPVSNVEMKRNRKYRVEMESNLSGASGKLNLKPNCSLQLISVFRCALHLHSATTGDYLQLATTCRPFLKVASCCGHLHVMRRK